MVPKPQRTILGRVSSYAEEAAAYLRRRRITRTPFARVHYQGGRARRLPARHRGRPGAVLAPPRT